MIFPFGRADDRSLQGTAMTQPSFATHDVLNQSPPFEDVNLFTADQPLIDAVKANGGLSAEWTGTSPEHELAAFGALWGSAAIAEQGRLANENTPKLRTYDAKGFRRDVVEFHPAYHAMMAHSAQAGLHNSTWTEAGAPLGGRSEVVRAAKFYMASQVESGHLCPITMTRASVAALTAQPDLLARTMPVIATRDYDPSFAPWWGKRGRTRQHDARRAHRRWLSHHRAQMVHVGADVRRLPGAGAGRSGPDLLLHAALCA
jgi:putative acyl-CoA dehydrogenase